MENNSVSKVNFAIENSLSGNLKFKSSKDKLEELKAVANQFESIFVNELLKQARKSKNWDPTSGILKKCCRRQYLCKTKHK